MLCEMIFLGGISMDAKEINNHFTNLKRMRMHFAPYKYLQQFVSTTTDIYEERYLLKEVLFDDKSIDYIVQIIVDDLYENRRFRRVECLKVLKTIIRNRSSQATFSKGLIEKLFYLYQTYIFTSNEEIQWVVSTFIKDQPLTEDQLIWLIENYQESDQIVNTLLRYPFRNQLITDWARKVLDSSELQNRMSEVIGILINEDIPEDIDCDNETLIWSIYYSKCTKSQKKKMILKYLDYEEYSPAIDVAYRLGIEEISKTLLKHYRGLLKSSNVVV